MSVQLQKSNIKIVERDKIESHSKQIHDRSNSGLDAGTSIKQRRRLY